MTIPSPTAPFDFGPQQEKNGSFAPANYKVEITSDAGVADRLAVVGRPLEIAIIPRNGNIDGTSCMVGTRLVLIMIYNVKPNGISIRQKGLVMYTYPYEFFISLPCFTNNCSLLFRA